MEWAFIIGLVFLLLLAYLILKAVLQSTHIIFYVLLVVLLAVLIFGISLTDVTDWFLQVLLWVL